MEVECEEQVTIFLEAVSLDLTEIWEKMVSMNDDTLPMAVQHTREHRIDQLESLIDFLAHFGAGQDDLAADEDQEHNLGLHHTVDQTGEQFRLIGAEVVMATRQTLQTDGELDVARADDVLDLEIRELGIEAKFLDDTRVLAGRQLRVIFRLGTGDDHLARGKDQRGGLGLTDTHDHGGETLFGDQFSHTVP